MIKFTVSGEPVAKGRPRATAAGGFVRMYTPKKTATYEEHVAYCAIAAMNESGLIRPLECPVKIDLVACMPIPKSMSKKKREQAIAGLIVPAKKPDIDNVAKSILDGLNGVVFKDDNQIVQLIVTKCYSDVPKVDVSIVSLSAERG